MKFSDKDNIYDQIYEAYISYFYFADVIFLVNEEKAYLKDSKTINS